MYEPATSLSLHRLSRHSLQNRYESDEEAVSESDAGTQDLLSSPVGSQDTEIFDSDLSADDTPHLDLDFDRGEHTILTPPTIKRPRPVSSATIKRNSNATFDEDSYIFDPEESVVLELPSPDSSPQMASSTFLQPSLYVWPRPPQPSRAMHSRSRSVSPASIFSVEEADIQVAKKVTIMAPPTRPTVVLINALSPRFKSSKFQPTNSRSRENSPNCVGMARADNRIATPRSQETPRKPGRVVERPTPFKQPPMATSTLSSEEESMPVPSATINQVSEIPPVLNFPVPPKATTTKEYRIDTRAPVSDISMPPPLKVRTRRPPSMRSTSSASIHSHPSRPTTPFSAEDITPLSAMHNDISTHLARAYSPASAPSISSPPPYAASKRSGNPNYNVSNMLTSRSPLMRRRMKRKPSSSSIHSLGSLPSELGANDPSSSQISVATQPVPPASPDPQTPQKSNQRRHLRHNSIAPSGRGFMGLRFGKKSHTKP